jgi:hypothetical protein
MPPLHPPVVASSKQSCSSVDLSFTRLTSGLAQVERCPPLQPVLLQLQLRLQAPVTLKNALGFSLSFTKPLLEFMTFRRSHRRLIDFVMRRENVNDLEPRIFEVIQRRLINVEIFNGQMSHEGFKDSWVFDQRFVDVQRPCPAEVVQREDRIVRDAKSPRAKK